MTIIAFTRAIEIECPKCHAIPGGVCSTTTRKPHSVREAKARYDSTCKSEWTITVGGPYEGQEYTHLCDLPLGHLSLHSSTTSWTDEDAAS